VVRILIWTQGILYLALLMLGDSAETRFVHTWLAYKPSDALSGRVWTLLTSVPFHFANEPMSVLFDIAILWTLGGMFAHRWSQTHFLFFYLAGGVGGGVLHFLLYLLFPEQLSFAVLGASGASFALFAAFWLIFGESAVSVFGSSPFKGKYLFFALFGLEALFFFTGTNTHFPAEVGGVVIGWFLVTGRWRPAKAAAYFSSLTLGWKRHRQEQLKRRFRVLH